jgi:tetratricopeptide (TPR) repeat protein
MAMQGRDEEALAAADAAIAAEPQDFGSPVGHGELLDRMGRRAEAADSYRMALRIFQAWRANATPAEIRRYLRYHAVLLARLGRIRESIALVDVRLAPSTRNSELLALRREVRVEANLELERALVDCDNALETDPRNERASVSRGLILLKMGRWAEAERAFAALLLNDPANPDALYGRGLARQHLGQAESAAEDIAAARRQLFYIEMEFDRLELRQLTLPAAAQLPR